MLLVPPVRWSRPLSLPSGRREAAPGADGGRQGVGEEALVILGDGDATCIVRTPAGDRG